MKFKLLLILVAFSALTTEAAQSSIRSQIWPWPSGFNPDFDSANYYEPFQFKVFGNCADVKTVHFGIAYSWQSAFLGPDEKNRPSYAWLALQLFDDRSYWAEYEEAAIKNQSFGRTELDNLFTKKLEGKWEVSGDKIELSGIGSGIPTKDKDYLGKEIDAIAFRVTTNLHDPRVLSSRMVISAAWTNVGPKGVSINEFCQAKP